MGSTCERGLTLARDVGVDVVVVIAPGLTLKRERVGAFRVGGLGDGAIDRRHGLCLRPPCRDANSSPHLEHLNIIAMPSCFSRRCLRARACLSSVAHGPPPLASRHSPHLIEGGTGKGMITWSLPPFRKKVKWDGGGIGGQVRSRPGALIAPGK